MKTDASKYTYYLELQAVWHAALKVQLRASQTLSVPYLQLSRLSQKTIERMGLSLFRSFPSPPLLFQSLPRIQLLFRTHAPSLSYPKVKIKKNIHSGIPSQVQTHIHIIKNTYTARGVCFTDIEPFSAFLRSV